MPSIVAATEDATYTAQWEEISVITHQIIFDAAGGEGGDVQTVEEGAMPNPPEVTREGYSFAGWMPDLVAVSEDATYIAQWSINTYNAIFMVDGDVYATVPTVFGESIGVPQNLRSSDMTLLAGIRFREPSARRRRPSMPYGAKHRLHLKKPESTAIVDDANGFILWASRRHNFKSLYQ